METVTGSITEPILRNGDNYVIHCQNNIGKWGAGVSGPIGHKWPQARKIFFSTRAPQGGDIQIVETDKSGVFVVNVIGQNGIRNAVNPKPVRYDWLETGFRNIQKTIIKRGMAATIHTPLIGCGLAGGKWSIVERMLIDQFEVYGTVVMLYLLPGMIK